MVSMVLPLGLWRARRSSLAELRRQELVRPACAIPPPQPTGLTWDRVPTWSRLTAMCVPQPGGHELVFVRLLLQGEDD